MVLNSTVMGHIACNWTVILQIRRNLKVQIFKQERNLGRFRIKRSSIEKYIEQTMALSLLIMSLTHRALQLMLQDYEVRVRGHQFNYQQFMLKLLGMILIHLTFSWVVLLPEVMLGLYLRGR